jgi:hypothetical protein
MRTAREAADAAVELGYPVAMLQVDPSLARLPAAPRGG